MCSQSHVGAGPVEELAWHNEWHQYCKSATASLQAWLQQDSDDMAIMQVGVCVHVCVSVCVCVCFCVCMCLCVFAFIHI